MIASQNSVNCIRPFKEPTKQRAFFQPTRFTCKKTTSISLPPTTTTELITKTMFSKHTTSIYSSDTKQQHSVHTVHGSAE